MAAQRQPRLVAAHAAAVVDDADQPPPAALDLDLDAPRAGVERVLDQLLDHRGRPLDHLAGGDLVDHVVRQDLDRARLHLGR